MRTEKQKEQSRQSARRWYYSNKEKAWAASKQWASLNPERKKEISRESSTRRRALNPEKFRTRAKLWAKNNLHIKNKKKKIRRKEDKSFAIVENLRVRVWKALKGISKSSTSLELLGCPINFLRGYFSVFFQPGMTWENYEKVWHIDHKRPCASFDFFDLKQQNQCFHWTNLQPLFAKENILKGAKYVQDR